MTTAGPAVATAYRQLIALRPVAGVGSTMFTISPGRCPAAPSIDVRAPFPIHAAPLVPVIVGGGQLLRRPEGPLGEAPPPRTRFRDAVRHRAHRASLVGNVANGRMVFGVRIALSVFAAGERGDPAAGRTSRRPLPVAGPRRSPDSRAGVRGDRGAVTGRGARPAAGAGDPPVPVLTWGVAGPGDTGARCSVPLVPIVPRFPTVTPGRRFG
ncbi:hypothetical protein WHI96_22275 [Pseudonocardia tropica]|uniref:Uncharacterized protein n=1 Tax=Pseudonocardia tropica TaxID=681289 RepID=A0ABV1K033_9PSEU